MGVLLIEEYIISENFGVNPQGVDLAYSQIGFEFQKFVPFGYCSQLLYFWVLK